MVPPAGRTLRSNLFDIASSEEWLDPATTEALSQASSMCDESMRVLRALLAA